jgi:hypothetical protein
MVARKNTPNSSEWWENAYMYNDEIHVQYELEFNKDIIKPGNPVKIKNQRGVYKFRCLAHNIKLDVTWFDCIGPDGQWHSFYIDKLKCLVKPKRSRRRKVNT